VVCCIIYATLLCSVISYIHRAVLVMVWCVENNLMVSTGAVRCLERCASKCVLIGVYNYLLIRMQLSCYQVLH